MTSRSEIIERLETADETTQYDAMTAAVEWFGRLPRDERQMGAVRIGFMLDTINMAARLSMGDLLLGVAATMIPEGWTWDADCTLPSAGCDFRISDDDSDYEAKGTSKIAACALCIAALKAGETT